MKVTTSCPLTDIHTHILPAVDDGAQDLHQALDMIRLAYRNGTRTLLLTPHYRGKFKKNTPTWLRECFSILCQMAQDSCPGMKLYLGSEVHYEADVPDALAEERALTINGTQYVLLEFSQSSPRSYILHAVSEVTCYGYTPVIAHAERYSVFRSEPRLADEVLNMGALIQLNADSVMGRHGLGVKFFCHNLLKAGKVHFIASDAHDLDHRPPVLAECYHRICKKYGEAYAAAIFHKNPEKLLAGKYI